MEVVLVAALDRRRAIGRGNALPWHLPADLKRFKAITLGKPVLMGRKTADSIGRALPGRTNLVMTRSGHAPFDGTIAVDSIDRALSIAEAMQADEVCVIGGAEVYALALPHASQLRMTHVDTVVEDADAFFPAFDARRWRVVSREAHPADARHVHAFEFVDYRLA